MMSSAIAAIDLRSSFAARSRADFREGVTLRPRGMERSSSFFVIVSTFLLTIIVYGHIHYSANNSNGAWRCSSTNQTPNHAI